MTRRVLIWIAMIGVAGCAVPKKSDSEAPGGDMAGAAEEAGDEAVDATAAAEDEGDAGGRDSPEDLEAELARLERDLSALGVAVPGAAVGQQAGGDGDGEGARTRGGEVKNVPAERREKAAAGDDGDRCERICGLAQATCGLEDRICELAGRHEDESRYAAACDRARRDCQVAEEACRACSG